MSPVVEVTGIDGAGKSSAVRFLAGRLGWAERKVRPFTPGSLENEPAMAARLGPRAVTSYRSCLLAAALLNEAAALEGPAVFDRYIESARMWWAVKDVWPLPVAVADAVPAPDLVIFLDVPVEVGLARRLGTTEPDAASERAFLTACRDYLRNRAAGRPNWVTVPAAEPLADVLEAVAKIADSEL